MMKFSSFLALLLTAGSFSFSGAASTAPPLCTAGVGEPATYEATGVLLKEATLWVGHPKGHSAMAFLKIAEGTMVKILGLEEGYYRVNHRDVIGYVEQKLVKVLDSTPDSGVKGTTGTIIASAPRGPSPATTQASEEKARPASKPAETTEAGDYLVTQETSLRAAPDHRSKVLVRLPVGGQVHFLERTDRYWWKVEYDGRTGWAKCALLKQ
ncbi:MAG: SH3 domain-containing protein [Phaeodactylibacter sp.]|nr:SH3 domain-containing protein [Phaeodactylibacter sp.]MCB9274414.1 SH3 domain-containing protein [Lewinellaceae bacterium]